MVALVFHPNRSLGLCGSFWAHELAQKGKEKRCRIVFQPILQRFFSGKRGIRTPGPSQVNGFQDRRIRPLCHLSD